VRSEARVGSPSLAAIAGSNLAGGMDVCFLLSVMCSETRVSAMSRVLVVVCEG
jgi:hypothetical protein